MKNSQKTSKKLRLFVGLKVPQAVIVEAVRVQKHFQQKKSFIGRWTKPENLHLTLKFLGEVEATRVPQLATLLDTIQFHTFTAGIGELGIFSSTMAIKILWIHIQGEQLPNLQKKVDQVLSNHFTLEARFMSHLTIARVKSVVNRERFLKEIFQFKLNSVEFSVDEFLLIKSCLTSDGPVYTPIHRYSLCKPIE